MEVVACVVGVADVTARASSKIWKLCELWKDAPQDVYLLRDELGRASRFFDALKSGIEQSFPASLSPDMLVDFLSLLDQGHKTVSTLQLLFDDLLAPSNDSGKAHSTVLELSKTRKLYWLSRFHKTKRLRSSLRRTTEQIGLYMSLLTVAITSETATSAASQRDRWPMSLDESPPEYPGLPHPEEVDAGKDAGKDVGKDVDDAAFLAMTTRIISALGTLERNLLDGIERKIDSPGVRVEAQKGRIPAARENVCIQGSVLVSKSNPATTNPDIKPPVFRVHPNSVSACRDSCRCVCHLGVLRGGWQLKGLSWNMLGLLRVSFTSKQARECSDADCRRCYSEIPRRRKSHLAMEYRLPSWISNALVSVILKGNPGGPELLIRVCHVVDACRIATDATIFQAASQGDLKGVKIAMQQRPSCVNDAIGLTNYTPLSLAINAKGRVGAPDNLDVIRLLVRAGADPHTVDHGGLSPLECAFRQYLCGSPGSGAFLEIFSFEELLDDQEYTELHRIVCGMAPTSSLDAILHHPNSTTMANAKTTTGMTPLHLAALAANTDVVKRLLSSGADPNVTSDSRSTPLRMALLTKHPSGPETARILLAGGASTDSTSEPGLISVLHLLCGNSTLCEPDSVDLLERLLSSGYNIDTQTTPYNVTPLIIAASSNNSTIIPHLLRYGANINHQDFEGDTAITEAIYVSGHETLSTLLAHGANYRLRSNRGETILHVLARYGDTRMLEIVAEAKMWDIDANAVNCVGETAMDLLTKRKEVDEQFRYGFLQLVGEITRLSRAWGKQTQGGLFMAEESAGEDYEAEVFYDAEEVAAA